MAGRNGLAIADGFGGIVEVVAVRKYFVFCFHSIADFLNSGLYRLEMPWTAAQGRRRRRSRLLGRADPVASGSRPIFVAVSFFGCRSNLARRRCEDICTWGQKWTELVLTGRNFLAAVLVAADRLGYRFLRVKGARAAANSVG